MLILLVLAIAGFSYLLRNTAVRRRFHKVLLIIPLVSRLERGLNTGRFARTFSILTASGVPVLEAMRISAQVMSNLPMREAVTEATARVREGAGIAAALERSGYFRP